MTPAVQIPSIGTVSASTIETSPTIGRSAGSSDAELAKVMIGVAGHQHTVSLVCQHAEGRMFRQRIARLDGGELPDQLFEGLLLIVKDGGIAACDQLRRGRGALGKRRDVND